MAICEDIYFPFKIENIGIRNGPYPKEYYWDSFQINKNNKILHKYKRSSKFELLFNVPQMPQNYAPLNIAVHFRNLRKYEVRFEMKRVQLCNCQYVTKQISVNKYKKVFNCIHRNMLDILPLDDTSDANGLTTVNIEFQYCLEGINDLLYTMNSLGFALKWRFHFDIKKVDPSIMILTKTLLPVQLSEAYPPHQPIWMFNPFSTDIFIGVENLSEHLDVLTIISSKDIVLKPKELKPLIVDFNPLEVKSYALEMLVKWTKEDDDIEGCFLCGDFGIKFDARCKFKVKDNIVRQSSNDTITCLLTPLVAIPNHLDVELKQKTTIIKVINLKNNSKDGARYSWIPLFLENYYKIDVNPPCGTMKSGKFKKFEITIRSEGTACWFTDILLKCNICKYAKNVKPKTIYPPGYFQYTEKFYCEKLDSPPISRNQFLFQTNVSINFRVYNAMNIDESLSVPDQMGLPSTIPTKLASTDENETELPELFDKQFLDKMLWMTLDSAELNFDLDLLETSESLGNNEEDEEEQLFEDSINEGNDNFIEKLL